MLDYGVIDCWINPNFPTTPGGQGDVSYLFKGFAERSRRGTTLPQMLDEMDAAGIERGILCVGYGGGEQELPWVLDAIEKHPERFSSSLVVDPRHGMRAVRAIEQAVREHNCKLIRLVAFTTQIPYDHPYCFPIYAKCIELGVAVGVNVGIPGPRFAGKCQDPISLDEVCWFFPELKVVMQHGGEPWADLCVKLMLKWQNLYYMSSAFAPKHLPAEIVQFMNTRGADKVMFASDYPLLAFDRCVSEIEAMPFRDDERRRKFARDNAVALFYAGETA
jgi:predicted TIM-barrel fold metal-dependent hydrolase